MITLHRHRFALLLLISLPHAVLACGKDDDYIGSICMTAAKVCPRGTLEADGRTLPVAGNNSLAQVIGNTYGGTITDNGQSGTFGLPDLRGRSPAGLGTGMGLAAITPGAVGGVEQATLKEGNLPAHSHTFDPTGASSTVSVSLKVSTGPGQTDTASASNPYLAVPQQVDAGGVASSLALWSGSLSNPVNVGGLTATTTLSGGAIGKTGGGQPVYTRSPYLGVRFCIVAQGIYPPSD